jgi:hypothetical protein
MLAGLIDNTGSPTIKEISPLDTAFLLEILEFPDHIE